MKETQDLKCYPITSLTTRNLEVEEIANNNNSNNNTIDLVIVITPRVRKKKKNPRLRLTIFS